MHRNRRPFTKLSPKAIGLQEDGRSRTYSRPGHVVFCDIGWEILGHKCAHQDGGRPLPSDCEVVYGPALNGLITEATSIQPQFLVQPLEIFEASIACRMSWAANRETTKSEDIAYCLLGIFEVNMPLLYGEGMKAFLRLQEELVRRSQDQSLFVWHWHWRWPWSDGMFATDPSAFWWGHLVQQNTAAVSVATYSLAHNGIEMRVTAQRLLGFPLDEEVYVFPLNCMYTQSGQGKTPDPTSQPIEMVVSNASSANKKQFIRIAIDIFDKQKPVGERYPPAMRLQPVEMQLFMKAWDFPEGNLTTRRITRVSPYW